MTEQGYYRHPTLFDDRVVFVCEDDLWTVSAAGGVARQLTSNPGRVSSPACSPDGTLLAFSGRDEGTTDVYVMPSEGGEARRLTYSGAQVAGWTPEGDIVYFSSAGQAFASQTYLYALSPVGGEAKRLPTGPAVSLSYGPDGGQVIGRNTRDLARWKRYRGGTAGELWLDADGDGRWRELIDLNANAAAPLWLGECIYFVSDHEGTGNLYSCTPSGEDLQRHTHHEDFYVRHPSTDGKRIIYHAGADLFLLEPSNQAQKIEVDFHSSRPERKRKFVPAAKYLQGYALHPEGKAVALTTRGKVYSMNAWEGAAVRHGEEDAARYYGATYLHDGKRIALVSDAGGEDALEIHPLPNEQGERVRLESLDIGRPYRIVASPTKDELAMANHRNELLLIDLETQKMRVLDRSPFYSVRGIAWSPDGRWLAYGLHTTAQTCVLKLCELETGETHRVTEPVLWDGNPAFDPAGKYLYFISYRTFNPVYDNLHFDLGFPKGGKPYLITLQADTPSPFLLEEEEKEEREKEKEKKERKEPELVEIDLKGIQDRIVAFPVSEGLYAKVVGLKDKVLFSSYPVEGALDKDFFASGAPPAKGKLELYDFKEQKRETLVDGFTSYEVSQDASTLIYRAGNRLRVLKAGEKPPKDKSKPGRKSGWLELSRAKVSVLPHAEWTQMLRETWRRQRDHFWTEDMSGIDWQEIYERYLPLVERVATRSEVSDLLWEMQGELGTSHAYEFGGDYRPEPAYHQGFLGADLRFDETTDSYVIDHIVWGDVWNERASSPLRRPGLNVREGERVVAVGGQRVSRELPPAALLVNQAGNEVLLTLADGDSERSITVKTLRGERAARYRDWVEGNRAKVHEATDGRIGYLHIPDMGARGYAEFHRGLLLEASRTGLVIDVRYNGGGHVSPLLLEKLARERRGYSVSRWGTPQPHPSLSFDGPLVALTNEFAGSDGDIFSHGFKMMNLGPLVGKRTWGGVIGITRAAPLSDGSITTQPEYAFWFDDVGWQVENYGTDPTIEVDIRPQDAAVGEDPQLERAVEEALRLLDEAPPEQPDFGERPRLAPPPLPKIP